MKSPDLRYIFENIPGMKRNIYKKGITRDTQGIYIDYLKENNINHNVKSDPKKPKSVIKRIEILRKDDSLIAAIKNPFYPTNSVEGRRLINDKYIAEKHLRKYGIATTESNIFDVNELEKAKKEVFDDADSKLVIKPKNMSLGKGVFVNLSKENFDFHWEECKKILLQKKRPDYSILVQKYLEGFEVRCTVLEGKLLSVIARVPPFVIGDGVSNIEELINNKNSERNECGFLSKNLIKKSSGVKEFIKSEGLSFESIPDKEEYVLLNSVSNISYGGEIVNITELVSDEIKNIALDAIGSIPGMHTGGIDVMIKNFDDVEPHIIEVNAFPVIALTKYPTFGEPSDPARQYIHALIAKDQYLNEKPRDGYEIDDAQMHIKDYLNFYDRKQELSVKRLRNNQS